MTPTTLSKEGFSAVIIHPEELMIGNILEYKGKIVHVTTLSLDIDDEYQETIGFCEFGKTTDEICDWNRALANGLKPIILNHDLLKKLGFINKRIDGHAEIDGTWWCDPQYAIKSLFEFDKAKGKFYWGRFGVSIDYLHELQNIWKWVVKKKLVIDPSIFYKQQ